jgi:hypothetical protein
VFSRAPTGRLEFDDVLRNGEGNVQGLDGPRAVTVSPDGGNVYVASSDFADGEHAVAVFSRSAASALGFEQVLREGEGDVEGLDGARSITVTPDGSHVYVVADGAVVGFLRSTAGMLRFEEAVRNGEGGVRGLGGENLTVSPDGANVYVAGFGGVVVFAVTD